MNLSLCPQPFAKFGLEGALDRARRIGLSAIELPVDRTSPFVDLDELLRNGVKELRAELSSRGMAVSAISNHQEGQLLLGPHHRDTDHIHPGTAAEKRAYARRRLIDSARLAAELEIGVVVGFTGCEDYTRSFPWPDRNGWEKMIPEFTDVVGSLLDEFDRLGVDFAHEPHPKQFVYDIETAIESIEHLADHPRWKFNFDPANLFLAGVDPVVFVAELGNRIRHVHAKDAEIVPHNIRRSGMMAHGAWDRKDRGFRFRVPGWGDIPWKRIVTELILAGYKGYLAIENEDPIFSPEDGIKKATEYLLPLLPLGEREDRWW